LRIARTPSGTDAGLAVLVESVPESAQAGLATKDNENTDNTTI